MMIQMQQYRDIWNLDIQRREADCREDAARCEDDTKEEEDRRAEERKEYM